MKHFFCLIIFAFCLYNPLLAQTVKGIEKLEKCYTETDGSTTSYVEYRTVFSTSSGGSFLIRREEPNANTYLLPNPITGTITHGFCGGSSSGSGRDTILINSAQFDTLLLNLDSIAIDLINFLDTTTFIVQDTNLFNLLDTVNLSQTYCMLDVISSTSEITFNRVYDFNNNTFTDYNEAMSATYTPSGMIEHCDMILPEARCFAEVERFCDFLINGTGDMEHNQYYDRDGNILFIPSNSSVWNTSTLEGQQEFVVDLEAYLQGLGAIYDSIIISSNILFNEVNIRIYGSSINLYQFKIADDGADEVNTSRIEAQCINTGRYVNKQKYYSIGASRWLNERLEPVAEPVSTFAVPLEEVNCDYEFQLVKKCYAYPDTIAVCDYLDTLETNVGETLDNFSFYNRNGLIQNLIAHPSFNLPYAFDTDIANFEIDMNSFLAGNGFVGSFNLTNLVDTFVFDFIDTDFRPLNISTSVIGTSSYSTSQNCEHWINGSKIYEVYFEENYPRFIYNEFGVRVFSIPAGGMVVSCDGSNSTISSTVSLDCETVKNQLEDSYIDGLNSVTILAGSVYSYSFSIIEGTATITRNSIVSPYDLPQGYSEAKPGVGCKYLANEITITGTNATSKIKITTTK